MIPLPVVIDIDVLDIDGVAETPTACDNCGGTGFPPMPPASNEWQEDYDGDGMGDACDMCPLFYNPGGMPCQPPYYESPGPPTPGSWFGLTIYLAEEHIYGSGEQGRFSMWKPDVLRDTTAMTATVYVRNLTKKEYEIKDHLGNMRVVISDLKLGNGNKPFVTDMRAYNNYYAYGMLQPGRSWQSGGYRYGFNGKEGDNEVSGTGNQYDYGFRIYNSRVCRFLSVDPLTEEYADLTPYQFGSNTPIWAIDQDGLEKVLYDFTYSKDKVTVTKITLKEAGPLGSGYAFRTNRGGEGSTQYFYGTDMEVGESPGQDYTRAYEGLSLERYNDHLGNPTIGWGHLIKKNEQDKYPEGTKLTDEEAAALFAADYKAHTVKPLEKLKELKLLQNQKDALSDIFFNAGAGYAAKFLASEHKDGRFFLRFMQGNQARGLWKRRFGEYILFEDGLYVKPEVIANKKSKKGKAKTASEKLDDLYKSTKTTDGKTNTETVSTEKTVELELP